MPARVKKAIDTCPWDRRWMLAIFLLQLRAANSTWLPDQESPAGSFDASHILAILHSHIYALQGGCQGSFHENRRRIDWQERPACALVVELDQLVADTRWGENTKVREQQIDVFW